VSKIWRTASGENDEFDDAKYGLILRAILNFLKILEVVYDHRKTGESHR